MFQLVSRDIASYANLSTVCAPVWDRNPTSENSGLGSYVYPCCPPPCAEGSRALVTVGFPATSCWYVSNGVAAGVT